MQVARAERIASRRPRTHVKSCAIAKAAAMERTESGYGMVVPPTQLIPASRWSVTSPHQVHLAD
jgi:hypothetical protein